ncbi:SIS domain-containing protein [Angustibacter sp. McL0619]|uniref:SIS domain-containing protein n=1 Tax=Angustibacter sp. McL0619 TaxID=3415676 RepID=UPI003CF73C1A
MSTDTGHAATHVGREIRHQPQAWATALSLLPDLTDLLPQPGERVAVIGCGTSWFMAAAYASRRELGGAGETDHFAASQFPAARRYDRVVAISRSGTTTEVVRAIEATGSPVVAITAVRDSPVEQVADHTIVLDFADELSVVQTVFATTVLMLLRGSLGESLEPVIAQASEVLASENPYPPELVHVDQITFLGQDWAFGVAQEAALKLREAAQGWTEAYPQMEYRHGPISVAQPGRAVWVFGRPVPGLASDIAATGAQLVDAELDPVADLVRAQLLAVSRAQAQRLHPDQPRNLTRSVVLAQDARPTP